MKRIITIILCIASTLIVLILVFFLYILYMTNYKKSTCDTSISPDGKYELILQAIGEPDWPFGSASGRLILKKGKDKISETDFELHDDGGSISSDCWKVTWYGEYVEVVLSGEEQYDEQFVLYFDGKKDSHQLTDIEESTVLGEKEIELFISRVNGYGMVDRLPGSFISRY